MRILHVLDHSLPEASGYSFRSHAIILEQRKLGWSTYQLTGPRQGTDATAAESVDGLEFFRTSSRMPRWAARAPLDFLFAVRQLRRRLRSVLADVKPDIIHAHSPCTNGLAALGLGRPLVYEMRTLWEDGSILAGRLTEGSMAHRVARSLESAVLRRADGVVTISDGLRGAVIARGVAASRIVLVPNAVDTEKFHRDRDGDREAARARFGVSSQYILGYVGSLFQWEGLELLLEALARLRALNVDAGVLIVGTGPHEQQLKESAERFGIADHVTFTGRIPHQAVASAYAAIDVLVYPRLPMRLTELVTPLKPLEAMALGKALIASNVGGHRELVQDGRTGILFRAGDSHSLVEAATRLLRDTGLRQRLCADGLSFVRAERTWSSVVRAYGPMYQRLLERVR